MTGASTSRVVLLSVHPRHAEAILSGRKRVELRRVAPSAATTRVVLYATAPVKAIIGWCEVAGIDEDTPSAIWKKYKSIVGVSRREFRTYFSGASRAVAIRISRPHRLRETLPLSRVPGVARAPQSFQYLAPDAVARILTT